MAHELFVFTKSLKDRLDDMNSILNNRSKVADIQNEWSNYVEFSIEPVGWRAIWKMSRDLCIELKLYFPYTTIVTVQEINFKQLTCTVVIDEVEESSICIPTTMTDVPLIELYPTIEQEDDLVLSKLVETAKVIDSLRFFYNNIWMPWDADYDDDDPWVFTHLEGRLKLHFALLEHQVPNEIAYTLRLLKTEGRKIQKEIEDIQDQLSDEMEVDCSSTKVLELAELHNRMSALKRQYLIYEKPELLEAFIQRAQKEKKLFESESCEAISYITLKEFTPDQLSRLAKMVSQYKQIRFFQSLQEMLVKAPANSSVSVLSGEHPVHDLGNLTVGGSITGLEGGAVLIQDADSPSTWNLLNGTLSLTNLSLQINSVWTIIKVRPGAELILQDVQLEGSSEVDGVDVFPGGKLIANNCRFRNCRTAILCDTNTTSQLTNCVFENNSIAIEVKEGCCLVMENCTVSGSSMYGINVSGQGPWDQADSLNSIPGMNESGTKYMTNALDLHLDSHNTKEDSLSTSR